MNDKKRETKEELLADIEKLMQYGPGDKETINPNLLTYLDLDTLASIKASLLKKAGSLSDEDKLWLQQFRKAE
jgi:hypothetical protein